MNKISILAALVLALWTAGAEAQLSRGTMRFSIDGDMLAVGGVKRENELTGAEGKSTVVGFGPNQHGNARLSAYPTPIGLGFGYVLQPKLILGLRTSLGYDVYAPDGGENTRILNLALMPGITFVPLGQKAKLALHAAPIFQVAREKQDTVPTRRTLLGGFALGVGALIFVHSRLSADIGFHFEGRFGGYDDDNRDDNDTKLRDLRGVVRLGVSFWR
jgi:hypothetical protein